MTVVRSRYAESLNIYRWSGDGQITWSEPSKETVTSQNGLVQRVEVGQDEPSLAVLPAFIISVNFCMASVMILVALEDAEVAPVL